ncbi:alpha/beta hydrolase family protein (macronuclear) [Tetrahymena thermophila SB210]|uniref:Alpha/beta hydrolase family protein n=1 Tax=Tetrahymena thermophila (strain SB210) TaxID=312017 RepID=I7LXU2_TETTS|nr:alpha/beta hydrolase family protein [Tetrahymena thermophila SB210]EAS06200.2 alpha/beta hydrolase family protein [Tetrahymena thermophila SB210]|eukprot:XP_001026445.2 alpha/beta hydrolase family protein [Tetrahymena thermophila SB210]
MDQANQLHPLFSVDRTTKEYQEQKIKRILEAKQDAKWDFPNPREGTAFPEMNFMDFKVIQDKKEIKLATFRYKPTNGQEPKALFLLFHGMNSSVTHGSHIAKALADVGFCVVGFDHRGYGASEGIRGYLESFEIHLQDCRAFVNKVEEMYGKQIKKFIGGLSMGGMSSYNMSLENPHRFAGVVLFAPALKPVQKGFAVKFVKSIVGTLAPKWCFVQQTGKNAHRSLKLAEYQAKDPYSYIHKLSAGSIKTIYTAMEKSYETFGQYNAPFLVIQGGLDKCVDPDLAFDLMEKSPSKDKQIIYYEGMWHDIWHEPEIYEILPQVVDWCLKRV